MSSDSPIDNDSVTFLNIEIKMDDLRSKAKDSFAALVIELVLGYIAELEGKVEHLAVENARLREAMSAVASMPGRDWLLGQLALADALNGGGEHLDCVLQ